MPARLLRPVSPLPRRRVLAGALALPLAALTACSADSETSPASDGGAESLPAGGQAVGPLRVEDAWAKAAESGMTAAFGSFTNPTGGTITLVSATSKAAAEVQLHETAADGASGMVMREKEGGFPIASGETLALEPGGYHLMLMGPTAPLLPGDEITLSLTFDDGSTGDLVAAVREFTGAEENYGGSDGGGMDDMHG